MRLCVIPARGGSKRIPRKNMKIFCGKPIIAWSIEAAIKSKCFDKIIVSTDNQEISDISCKYGAEVPFLRPKDLSDDFTGTTPVVKHAIEWINKNGKYKVDFACCIYATAPFIEAHYIKEGYEKLIRKNAQYSISVTSYSFPIQRAIKIIDDEKIIMIYPENFNKRSQDLEETFHDAGQFCWGKSSAWLKEKVSFAEHTVPVIIPRYKVQDIDNKEDWEKAVIMFKSLRDLNSK